MSDDDTTPADAPGAGNGAGTAAAMVRSDVTGGRGRRLGTWALETWVLSAFAVAQPLFALLGDNATFFVAHRVAGAEIVWFAIVLVLGVPAVLFLVDVVVEILDVVVERSSRSRRDPVRLAPGVHVLVLGILVAVTVTPPLARAVGLGPLPWLGSMVLVAIGAAVALARWLPLRRVVRYAAFAPVLFLGLFLFASPAADLVTGGTPSAADPAAVGTGAPGPGTAQTPPIVWMVLDEFSTSLVVGPDGQLSAERFPNLARLAAMSTWYPNYTAGAVFTEKAVPAMLTGRWPEPGRLPIASQQPVNVFDIVAGPDYPVTAYEFLTDMCPTEVCTDRPEPGGIPLWGDVRAVYLRHLLPESVADRFVGRIDQNWTGFERPSKDRRAPAPVAVDDETRTDSPAGDPAGGDDAAGDHTAAGGGAGDEDPVAAQMKDEEARWALLAEMAPDFNGNVDLFDEFVEPLDRSDLHGLHYIHMRLPHGPVRYLPDGRKYLAYFEPRTQADGAWPDDEAAMRTMMQRTVVQAMYADHLIGRTLDALEASGRIDDTVIVVASDHGGSVRPGVHPRSMSDTDSASDSVPTLLMIKDVGQTHGAVDLRRAQQVDILPTVLEAIGMDPHAVDPTAGSSALDGLAMTPRHDREWEHRTVVRLDDEDRPVEYPDPPVVTDSPTIGWIASMLPDPTNPYAVGPAGSVVGRTVDVPSLATAPYSILPDAPDAFTDVRLDTGSPLDPEDLAASFLPVLVSGVIDRAPGPVHVAVVVGDRVAGVGESFVYGDEQRVSVLIDPRMLTDGHNDVSFLVIDTDAVPFDPTEWKSLPVRSGS